MKKHLFYKITRRGWIWIGVLYIGAVLYYWEFFSLFMALGLGVYITLVLVSMLLVGYLRLGTRIKFPVKEFILFVILFSVLRQLYIAYFLSENLPSYTVFHYPNRVWVSNIFGTASLLFIGYSYVIYEWGLAAREKYKATPEEASGNYVQPLIIKANGARVYLLPQDILYVAANGEYVDYHTTNRKYTVFKRLKTVEAELTHLGFKRCHRSYIINLGVISSLSTSSIVLQNDIEIPMSKTYRNGIESSLYS